MTNSICLSCSVLEVKGARNGSNSCSSTLPITATE